MSRAFAASTFALISLTGALPAFAESAAAEGSPMKLSTPAPPARDSGPPLLFDGELAVGGYGGVDVMYTRMFGRDGAVVGAQGGLLINHRLALGVAGYGFTNPVAGPDNLIGDAQYFETGYGGFTLRYSLMSEELPVYVTVGGLVGGGAIDLTAGDHDSDDDFDNLHDSSGTDTFAVFQPDVTLNANLTRWMRLGVTAGYRFTAGVNSLGFEESDLNGIVAGGHVQFGWF